MAVLTVKDLVKDYKTGKVITKALRGIDLEIAQGEFLSIAGPSGSGKTTLLNIIGCLDTPTSGSVSLNGTNLDDLKKKERAELRKDSIGFVFQSFNLIPVLTAFENVEIPLILLGWSNQKRKETVENILIDVGLQEYIHRRPLAMSGGQQQRVAVARALVKEPKLILADEPTANLDSTTGKATLELMRELNEKHDSTFIFSTHDKMVMDFADRLILLKDGKVSSDTRKGKKE
ncbi:ATP-binding cassette domain-containing protein [candidate division WOR-3 bacterium]|uniref:ATP-binding cassette domain-containing protein n=1 Tax=candidate division WOR-3 bacterium TaxID=2052148 RepID=A0A9D5QF62_UNCW3|nr:ATP-binding cassette domain-containing protein [candidate division WOR-3 bacterium]MBD3365715.1 ATP-binding cassette domain-containing protein [candidate division WOR-3 bacterium]